MLFGVIDNQKLVFDVQNDPPPPGKGESQNRLLDCWPPAQLKEQSVQCPQGPQAPSTRVEKIIIFAKGIDFAVGPRGARHTQKQYIPLVVVKVAVVLIVVVDTVVEVEVVSFAVEMRKVNLISELNVISYII